jgi:tRNA threonylcarbamoyladenosine biosynthesis protein TsaE
MNYTNLSLVEVKNLAKRLSKKIGKDSKTIGFLGNLGAGKTTFIKAFAKSFGIKSIKSPTFIISQRYLLPKNRFFYHLDFYRLNQAKQLIPLGLSEILQGGNIVVIEWIDKFPSVMRKCDILISLKVKPHNKRDVQIKFN